MRLQKCAPLHIILFTWHYRLFAHSDVNRESDSVVLELTDIFANFLMKNELYDKENKFFHPLFSFIFFYFTPLM